MDDTINKEVIKPQKEKKQRKPMTEQQKERCREQLKKINDERRARKEALAREASKILNLIDKEEETKTEEEEVKKEVKQKTKQPIIIQDEDSEEEEQEIIIKKKTKKQPKIIVKHEIEEVDEPEQEPIKKVIKSKTKPKNVDNDLTPQEIKEYIRLKSIETDELKKAYMLKDQIERENRFKKAYASIFS